MSTLSVSTLNRSWMHRVISILAMVFVVAWAADVDARGRGGGGGFRGGGGGGMRGGGGGISRGGPARGGSIRNERAGGGYRSYEGGRRNDADFGRSRERDRTRDDRRVDTMDQDRRRERREDSVDREDRKRARTEGDSERRGVIKKTDDGFIAAGRVDGKNGSAAGVIVRDGDQTRVRGVATDGNRVVWRGANCSGSRCYGGRVVADRRYYYVHPYYYYPYYYGWYSCPIGSVNTWHSRYGTPVYGCSNVVVVHTTISMGSSTTTVVTSGSTWPAEARVSSEPVLMFEASPDVSVYGTPNEPAGVYSVKQDDRYYWAPGPSKESADAKKWTAAAGEMKAPTANSTVITYAVGDRFVYLTNEAPLPGYFSERADELYVWIPGVENPTDEEKDLIARVIKVQRSGGKDALDREVRKLETGREPPPSSPSSPEPAPS